MMDKPLHVQVAEALGCKVECEHQGGWCGCGSPWPHGQKDLEDGGQIGWLARYNTDWSATGPLIEQFRPTLSPLGQGWRAELNVKGGDVVAYSRDASPLVAVCRLIVALQLDRDGKAAPE